MTVLTCPLCCDEHFPDRASLKLHLLKIQIRCSMCFEQFLTIADLVHHLIGDCDRDMQEIGLRDENPCALSVLNPLPTVELEEKSKDCNITAFDDSDIPDILNQLNPDEFLNNNLLPFCIDADCLVPTCEGIDEKILNDIQIENNSLETDPSPVDCFIIEENGAENELFTCNRCNMSFASVHEHINTFHVNEDVIVNYKLPKSLAMNELNCKIAETGQEEQQLPAIEKSCNQDLVCDCCNREFKDEVSLNVHKESLCKKQANCIDATTNMIQTQCDVCNVTFEDLEILRQHMVAEHNLPAHSFTCQYCPKSFDNRTHREEHERKHTKIKPHMCTYCGRTFSLRNSLVRHIRIHTKENPFSCAHCGKSFRTQGQLKNHIPTHSTDAPYKCRYCPKQCKTKVNLRKHEFSHDKPYACPKCTRPFDAISRVKKHLEKHESGKLTSLCNICPQMFSRPTYLLHHLSLDHGMNEDELTISDSKIKVGVEGGTIIPNNLRYECTQCLKKFKAVNVLHAHMKTHVTGPLIKCPDCPKTFKSKMNARVHSYKHKRSFSCPLCTKPFDSSFKVKIHLKSHESGILRYTCSQCPQMFRTFRDCSNHLTIDHEAEVPPKEDLLRTVEADNVVTCIVCEISICVDDYEEHLKSHCPQE